MQKAEEFSRVLNLNVLGTMLCIKHAVPMLRKSDKASFVGMSSIASHLTHLWFGAYPAAKLVLKQSFGMRLTSMGQQIFALMQFAGFIETEIMEGIPRDSEIFQLYRKHATWRRWPPNDVAALVKFL